MFPFNVDHLKGSLQWKFFSLLKGPLETPFKVKGGVRERCSKKEMKRITPKLTLVPRYGPWMDTNMVIPTSHSTCTVVYDYFLQKDTLESLGEDKEDFLATSLAASDQVNTTC